MAKKHIELTALEWVGGVLVTAFTLNYLFVWIGWRPFVYCVFGPLLWQVFQPFQVAMSLMGLCVMVYGFMTGKRRVGIAGMLMLILAYLLPSWSHILFGLGKACNG